jgi:cellulose synthase/poly-beta-1,6-N-acetylglucosamine synthase-like glycosyltransferase
MTFFLIIAGLICLIFFGIQVYTLLAISDVEFAPVENQDDLLPKASLLLAARNEEDLIIRSLTSISELNYPKDKLEVLIGNDGSTDETESLTEQFIRDRPHFKLINIRETLGLARGKANVLAHLAHHAQGEIFLITDVDVKLPENWVRSLVHPFQDSDVGIVSGTTYCAPVGSFGTLQSIDWLHFMGYIKAFAHRGISCTSVGNNMAVRAEAYRQTGGYENLRFSITEDYRLFEEVTQRDWGYRNLIGPDCLGEAWPIESVLEMLHQRKRWLIGAQDLPYNWKFMIRLYGTFYPVLIGLLILDWRWGLAVWAVKFVLQSSFITALTKLCNIRPFSFGRLVVYELYLWLNTISTAVFFFLPIRNRWKGRTYSAKNVA